MTWPAEAPVIASPRHLVNPDLSADETGDDRLVVIRADRQ